MKKHNILENLDPEGELVIQTVAMPAHANASGDIFGGWLFSQMDIGGAILAHQRAKNRVTTVAVNDMVFLKPVYIGDLISCYASILKTGRSSITIDIQAWSRRMRFGDLHQIAKAQFVFVAIDDLGQPKVINW